MPVFTSPRGANASKDTRVAPRMAPIEPSMTPQHHDQTQTHASSTDQQPESATAPDHAAHGSPDQTGEQTGEQAGEQNAPPAGTPTRASEAQVDDQVQAELDAAMGELEAAGLTGPADDAPKPTPKSAPTEDGGKKKAIRGPRVVQAGREHRKGIVASVGPNDVFLEFGPKELGVIERSNWKEDETAPAVGEEIEVIVLRYDKNENIFLCSRPGTIQKADWEMLVPGQVVEARVTGSNKGGLELEVAGHRAFMPAGQVDVRRIDDFSVFVGEKMECKVTRVDRGGKGNIVLSRREILQVEREKLAQELRSSLSEGQTIDGVVKKIMPFGAFVDIGGIDGLIHIADLSHDRVNMGEKNVEKYVKEGDQIRVQVLKLDWDANRIGLGLKQLQDDPFVSATEELVPDAIVTGKVKNLADFGAFVELPGGAEGLIHISELAYKRTNHPSEVVQPDQVIQVKVLKIDPDSRRISLSLKQTEERPKQAGDQQRRGGGGGGRGRDDRSPDEILKETPELRRLREKARAEAAAKGAGAGGLVRRTVDPLAEQEPAEKKQKSPAKKRKQENVPAVDGLDQLLNKFGGL